MAFIARSYHFPELGLWPSLWAIRGVLVQVLSILTTSTSTYTLTLCIGTVSYQRICLYPHVRTDTTNNQHIYLYPRVRIDTTNNQRIYLLYPYVCIDTIYNQQIYLYPYVCTCTSTFKNIRTHVLEPQITGTAHCLTPSVSTVAAIIDLPSPELHFFTTLYTTFLDGFIIMRRNFTHVYIPRSSSSMKSNHSICRLSVLPGLCAPNNHQERSLPVCGNLHYRPATNNKLKLSKHQHRCNKSKTFFPLSVSNPKQHEQQQTRR